MSNNPRKSLELQYASWNIKFNNLVEDAWEYFSKNADMFATLMLDAYIPASKVSFGPGQIMLFSNDPKPLWCTFTVFKDRAIRSHWMPVDEQALMQKCLKKECLAESLALVHRRKDTGYI